jgi:hypothetical protein
VPALQRCCDCVHKRNRIPLRDSDNISGCRVDEVAAVAQAQAKDDEEDLTVRAELAPAAPAPAPAGPAAPETMKNKHIKKEMSKKEALEAEEYRRRWAEEGASTGDAREDELRRRALQERADLDLAVDSLSIKGFDNKTLVGLMSFSAPSDFEEFGKTIANKVTGSSGLKHDKAVTFFKVLLQTATESYFTLDEIKEVTKVLNNAATKKQQVCVSLSLSFRPS